MFIFDENGRVVNNPQNIRLLREVSGLSIEDMASLYGIGVRAWQKKEEPVTSSSHRKLDNGGFELLLLLAGQHDKFELHLKKGFNI